MASTTTDKKKKNNQITGNVGLFYCCHQLSLGGWNVMPTSRNTHGIDIIAYNSDASRIITIQVKTLSGESAVPLNKNLDKVTGDYWVIITNAYSSEPLVYLLPPKDVKELAESSGKDEKKSYWLEHKRYAQPKYSDAWLELKNALQEPARTA